ncbi:MAG TPA: glycogen synthase GlgA [Caldisericia bacterium]|nr:glycogen synthase GlgA [Caldisericia bacterium]HPB34332.1 glycogen synthase GlgA [Caldisericia bacterium]HQN48958.1 glycogen synthase GlgA [Caldisericia bacterium]HQO99680.1 glycogen synthase GlgA [Caldisericia bacterium]
MRVIFIASEANPYIKTGGLGDVVGSLPKYLKKLGVEVFLILPLYKNIKEKKLDLEFIDEDEIVIDKDVYRFKFYKDRLNFDYNLFFVENNYFFDRKGIYNEDNVDYPDNYLRFGLLSLASLKLSIKNLKPDIIHIHDWQTSLVPVYNKIIYNNNVKTILTIHNLAYQGVFNKDSIKSLGLPDNLFSIDKLEFYGNVNFLKGGIIFSDYITTVSPTYSKEIQKEEFGFGLQGVLKNRRENLIGILNGIDYDYWDPEKDKMIYKNYNFNNTEFKKENKMALFKELNVDFDIEKPLYSMITRITNQKGLDLILEIFDKFMELPINFIILGTGDKDVENRFLELNKIHKNKFLSLIKFDEELSHKIYASSDFFLMPSKFEPCGLSQMISLRYGNIPIVRSTGGLRDTIIEYNENVGCGNGFVFYDYESYELLDAIKRSLNLYNDREKLLKVIKIGMNSNFSWENSSKEYLKLYNQLLST